MICKFRKGSDILDFNISDEAMFFLKTKNIKYLTLNLQKANLCWGSASLPSVEYLVPSVLNQYDQFILNGINIYIYKYISLETTLKFVLKKFFLLKYIDVEGVKLF